MTHRDGFPRLSASTRVAWRCGTSVAMRAVSKLCAARKPWETAVPVAQANRRRASESLADDPHRPRLSSYPPIGPTDRLHDLYESLSTLLGIMACSSSAGELPSHVKEFRVTPENIQDIIAFVGTPRRK